MNPSKFCIYCRFAIQSVSNGFQTLRLAVVCREHIAFLIVFYGRFFGNELIKNISVNGERKRQREKDADTKFMISCPVSFFSNLSMESICFKILKCNFNIRLHLSEIPNIGTCLTENDIFGEHRSVYVRRHMRFVHQRMRNK